MTNLNNVRYSELYNGYFDIRDPDTRNLKEIYGKPVPIPIYTPAEIFTDNALDEHYAAIAMTEELDQLRQSPATDINLIYSMQRKLKALVASVESRDQDIFRYFHFIAARNFQLEILKKGYLAYSVVKDAWYRQKALHSTLSTAARLDQGGAGFDSLLQSLEKEIAYILDTECYQNELSEQVCQQLKAYRKDIEISLSVFYELCKSAHLRFKKVLLDFQSNLEEERKLAILNAY